MIPYMVLFMMAVFIVYIIWVNNPMFENIVYILYGIWVNNPTFLMFMNYLLK